MKLKKETLRWPRDQDKITSRCVHVLGFVYGKQDEMPARVVVPSRCHRARGTASLCMNTRCVLQEDCSENDEVFKSTLFFPCGKIFVQLQTCTLFHTVPPKGKLPVASRFARYANGVSRYENRVARYAIRGNFGINLGTITN